MTGREMSYKAGHNVSATEACETASSHSLPMGASDEDRLDTGGDWAPAEMSLSTLLYYILVGDRRFVGQPG